MRNASNTYTKVKTPNQVKLLLTENLTLSQEY